MHPDPGAARPFLLRGIPGVLSLFIATSAFAQTVDDVVARHKAAIGGETAIGRVRDRVERWAISLDMFGTTSKGKLLVKSKRPDRLIQKFDVDVSGQPIDWLIGFDGESGWEENQGAVSPVEGRDLVELRHLAWRVNQGELLWHEQAEADLKLLETAELDDDPAYIVELVPKEGKKVTYALDRETYLIRRITGTTVVQGVQAEMDIRPNSYRRIEGLRVPDDLSVEITVPEMGVQFTYRLQLDEMRVNTGLEDSDFIGPFGSGAGEEKVSPPTRLVEDILERHFEAIGGVAALEGIRDRVEVWQVTVLDEIRPREATITLHLRSPDLIRARFETKDKEREPPFTFGYDGQTWWREKGDKAQALGAEDVKREALEGLRFINGGDLFSQMEAGARFELTGKGDVNGRATHELQVTRKEEGPVTCQIDVETYQLLQVSFQQKGGDGQKEVQIRPRSHRVVEGVRRADGLDLVEAAADGKEGTPIRMELLDLKLNPGLKRSFFSLPGSEEGGTKRGWY